MGHFFAVYFALLCVTWVSCEEGAQNEDDTQYHNEKAKERVHLLQHLADRMDLDGEGLRHIKKHLQEVAGAKFDTSDVQDIQAGDNVKGIFYFFQLHDFDNNQKLDGLEWMAALSDYHKDESEKDDFKEGGKTFLQHEAEAIVDELLEKHDKNEDGYVDFYELMKSDVSSLLTDLDKQPEGQGESNNAEQQQQQSSLEQEFQQQQQQVQESQGEAAQQQDQASEQQQQQQQVESQENQEETPQQDESKQQQQQQQEPSSLEQEYEQKQEQQGQ